MLVNQNKNQRPLIKLRKTSLAIVGYIYIKGKCKLWKKETYTGHKNICHNHQTTRQNGNLK